MPGATLTNKTSASTRASKVFAAAAITALFGIRTLAVGDIHCQPIASSRAQTKTVFQTGFEADDQQLKIDGFQIVTEPVHTGRAAIVGQVNQPDTACFLRVPFHTTAAMTCEIRFWVRSDRGSRCALWARYDDGQRQRIDTIDRIPRSWTKVTTQFVPRVGKPGVVEIVAPSSYGNAPVGKAWIDDVTITGRPRPDFHSPPTEDFPALATDQAGQVWMAAVVRPIPDREIRVFRVGNNGRKLSATIRPEGLTGVGAPTLLPREHGCLLVFAAETDDRWRIALTHVGSPDVAGSVQYLDAGGSANIEPSAAIISDGRVCVVWESNADGVRGVYAAMFRGEGPTTKPVRISSLDHVSLNPAVVALDDGRLLAVWDSVRGGQANLYGAWLKDGKWEDEQQLTRDPHIERFAALATDGRDAWLAWQAQSYRDGHVTHLDVQRIVVARLIDDRLETPPGLFERISPPGRLQLRPRLSFDPQGRLWLSVRRSLYKKPAGGRGVRAQGTHSGWEPMLWCYSGQQWSEPARVCPTLGRWRPIPVTWNRQGQGIAAVQRDEYPPGWGIDTGIADDWHCDVQLIQFDPANIESANPMVTSPLKMPATGFRLAERLKHSSASFPRQHAKVAGKRLTLYWGDLHDHTDLSVCNRACNPPIRENYNTKRDIERLDFTAITDHGYNLDHPQWQWSAEQVRANYDPGRFVTLLGEEWTSDHIPYSPKKMVPTIGTGKIVELRRYGHHNIIFRDPYYKTFYDSRDGDISPKDVWDQLEDKHAVMIPHQLADLGNRPTDWSHHDEWRQPLAEIFQTRGSYEHLGCPRQAPRSTGVKGHFLQDAWQRGHVIGVIASPDHGGGDGKAGVWATELTRDALFDAFHARHTFGTTGCKMAMLVTSGDYMMGDKVPRHGRSPIPFQVWAATDQPITKLVIMRNNETVHTTQPNQKELTVEWTDRNPPQSGPIWYYVRLHRNDEELAWSSPIWFLKPHSH
jgi:hypothetical protein